MFLKLKYISNYIKKLILISNKIIISYEKNQFFSKNTCLRENCKNSLKIYFSSLMKVFFSFKQHFKKFIDFFVNFSLLVNK